MEQEQALWPLNRNHYYYFMLDIFQHFHLVQTSQEGGSEKVKADTRNWTPINDWTAP